MMQTISSINRGCTAKQAFVESRAHVSFRQACIPTRKTTPVAFPTRVMASAGGASTAAKIIIQGRSLEVTPAIRAHTEEKVLKSIHNFEGNIKEVDVKLSVRGKKPKSQEAHHNRDQIVEITVYTLRHGVVRVEDTESDLYGAIDLVSDKLKRKLSKIKEKAVQRSTWPGKGGPKGGPAIEDFLPAEESDSEDFAAAAPPLGEREPELPQELIREKVLMMQSATSMEAALEEMENVGHDFYIFLDEKDGAMKVVYRRKSYGYGIIIPQKV